jgi:hypothetical protein
MTASIPISEKKLSIAPQWNPATWADYERYRDDPEMPERWRLFFHDGYLKVNAMGWEGIGHSEVNQLFTMLIGVHRPT